jgi:DNA-directed RNA polymerase subunit beta'
MSTKAGISICMDDMVIPDSKKSILGSRPEGRRNVVEQYQEGLITDGERLQQGRRYLGRCCRRVARDLIDGISP